MTKKSAKSTKESIQNVESFFKDSIKVENLIEAQNNQEISESILAEESDLFKGDLTKLDDWIKYRKAILTYKSQESERKLREKNSIKAFIITIIWGLILVLIILLRGFYTYTCFYIESTEFVFIMGTLTVSMFAFYTLVMRYLFYRNEDNSEKLL